MKCAELKKKSEDKNKRKSSIFLSCVWMCIINERQLFSPSSWQQWSTIMVKSNNNYHHCSSSSNSSTATTRIKHVASIFASTTLRRWFILLVLLYKLDYQDYYCYGISSGSNSAAFNNENGKNEQLFIVEDPFIFHRRLLLASFSIECQFVTQTAFALYCFEHNIEELSEMRGSSHQIDAGCTLWGNGKRKIVIFQGEVTFTHRIRKKNGAKRVLWIFYRIWRGLKKVKRD